MKPSVSSTGRPSATAYTGLADLNIIGVLFWDADGNITNANDRFLQTVGYSREDLVAGALRWSEMTPGEWRAADADALEELAARGACTPFEKEYVRKDGTRVPVLLSALLVEESPDLNHGVAFVVDLSERNAQFAGVVRDIRDREAGKAADRERERLAAFSRDVGVAFAQSGTLARMLQLCAELMVTHLGAAAARIWTPNAREDGFRLLACAGSLCSAEGSDGPVTAMFFDVGEIARERTIVTSRVAGDPRFDQTWAAASRVAGFVGYPLIVSERVLGVITMFGWAPFSDATVQAISYVAHALASAIERERIEASQARLAAIVEATTDLVSIAILEGGVLNLSYINQAGRAMLGIGPQESVPDLSVFRTAESLRELNEVILPAVLRDGVWSGETTYVSRDGRLVPVSQLAFAQTHQGHVQFCNIARDITDRKRIEAELRATNERTRFAHAAAGIGIGEIEVSTGRMMWSESMPAMHGVADGSFDGTVKAYHELIHPDDREALQKARESAMATGADYSTEFRILWPDGSVHWLDVRHQIRRAWDGRGDRLFGVAIDVTERKALEAQLRQAQKMDAVGRLAGGVAHDFNNLLTVILGYAECLAAGPGCSDPQRRDVGEIIKAAERSAALTRQLLAFSRHQMLQPTLVDVNALVANMSDMLSRLIGEHIQLATVLAAGLGPVLADQGQLEQVLMNLTVNARDAMPQGGRLLVETAEVQLDQTSADHDQAAAPGRYVMLAVTDSGAGMDAETRRHLFEPFFTTKERGQGTGLGLATVYGIVKQSGGYIWVNSEPGHGATFKVYLPRSNASLPPEIVGPVAAVAARGSETVLLVEDEGGVRRLAQRILENAGYRVIPASDPAEAMELFALHRGGIDLVLTDVIMPGSSGPDLFQSLAAQEPTLKVLYMSGYTEDAVVRQAGLDRGQPFVHKPFTAAVLARTVREAFSHPGARPAPVIE